MIARLVGSAMAWKISLFMTSKMIMQPNGCMCQVQPNGFATKNVDRLVSELGPILLEQELFDPVGVQHLVYVEVAEHNEYRIMIECLVNGGFLPLVR